MSRSLVISFEDVNSVLSVVRKSYFSPECERRARRNPKPSIFWIFVYCIDSERIVPVLRIAQAHHSYAMKTMTTCIAIALASPRCLAFTARKSLTRLPFATIAIQRWPIYPISRLYFSNDTTQNTPSFQSGEKIQVEVISFGPLGASVEVIGRGHGQDDLISDDQPALGRGLILQKEIAFFREGRQNVDVVRGEILPAYVERVRDNGRIDISLRAFGGQAKADEVSQQILERLQRANGGVLEVGDKSPPEVVAREFPGVSKNSFKRAVANLYKAGKVKPGPDSITLIQ
jgi:hypothetical protein